MTFAFKMRLRYLLVLFCSLLLIHSCGGDGEHTLAGDDTKDNIPPSVTITTPSESVVTNISPINVSGTVDDDTAVITVNGIAATFDNGTFRAPGVPLIEGLNLLSAKATDAAGNTGSASVNVTYNPDLANTVDVVSGATLLPFVSPGSLASIFGTSLSSQDVNANAQLTGQLPTMLDATMVEVNGRFAELVSVSPHRIDFVVPDATELEEAVIKVVAASTGRSARGTVLVQQYAPGLFRSEPFDVDHSGALTSSPMPVSTSHNRVVLGPNIREFQITATGIKQADKNAIDVVMSREGQVDTSLPIVSLEQLALSDDLIVVTVSLPVNFVVPSTFGLKMSVGDVDSDTESYYLYDESSLAAGRFLVAIDQPKDVLVTADSEYQSEFAEDLFVHSGIVAKDVLITLEPSGQLPHPVTITINYGNSSITDQEVEQFSVFRINDDEVTDLSSTISIDQTADTLSFETDHFSTFVASGVIGDFLACILRPAKPSTCLGELVDAVRSAPVNNRCAEISALFETLALARFNFLDSLSGRILKDWLSGTGAALPQPVFEDAISRSIAWEVSGQRPPVVCTDEFFSHQIDLHKYAQCRPKTLNCDSIEADSGSFVPLTWNGDHDAIMVNHLHHGIKTEGTWTFQRCQSDSVVVDWTVDATAKDNVDWNPGESTGIFGHAIEDDWAIELRDECPAFGAADFQIEASYQFLGQRSLACPNICDGDRDDDGVPDDDDAFPWDPNEWEDTDGDGIGDNADPDDDDDGIPDDQDPDPKDPDNPSCDMDPKPAVCAPDPTFIQPSAIGNEVNAGLPSLLESTKGISAHDLAARIDVPFENSLVRGNIPVFGLAHGNNFKSYTIEVGKGAEPAEWHTLATSSKPQETEVTPDDLDDSSDLTIHGNLATWDTGLKNYVYLPTHPEDHPIDLKGVYTLRLVVSGIDGQSIEDRVTVKVANVISNAWGGRVISPDGRFVLTVPEQAIRHSFRLLLAESMGIDSNFSLDENRLVGNIYKLTESGESFTKHVRLEIDLPKDYHDITGTHKMAIFGYDASTKRWEPLKTSKHESNMLYTMLQSVHDYYAIMETDLLDVHVAAERVGQGSIAKLTVSSRDSASYLIHNDFENGTEQWSNRDGAVGATIDQDKDATSDSTGSLRISNTNFGGNFGVNVLRESFDARDFPVVRFDYRIPKDVKTNFLVRVSGRWYEIGFTDDKKDLRNKRVNIAHIGNIENVVADDQWHTARFNLFDMLRTKTGHSIVEEMIMADWDVPGYMKLQFGTNARGVSYYIDNFSIGREVLAGSRTNESILKVDDFNRKNIRNLLGEDTSVFRAENSLVYKRFSPYGSGEDNALSIHYDVTNPNGYAGYITNLGRADLRKFESLTFDYLPDQTGTDLLVGLMDRSGRESKLHLKDFLQVGNQNENGWSTVSIPLKAFKHIDDWSAMRNLSLAVKYGHLKTGEFKVDNIEFSKRLPALLIDNFENGDNHNSLGRDHWTYVSGAAAINGSHTQNSPNVIYRLSFGGNIGIAEVDASDHKSFAGWATDLGGINCSDCDTISLKVRGAEGGENVTLYLDDGSFRWGVKLGDYSPIGEEWQKIDIPVEDFARYGVDMTHLSEMHVVFEGAKMSGTIYLDDIRINTPES